MAKRRNKTVVEIIEAEKNSLFPKTYITLDGKDVEDFKKRSLLTKWVVLKMEEKKVKTYRLEAPHPPGARPDFVVVTHTVREKFPGWKKVEQEVNEKFPDLLKKAEKRIERLLGGSSRRSRRKKKKKIKGRG